MYLDTVTQLKYRFGQFNTAKPGRAVRGREEIPPVLPGKNTTQRAILPALGVCGVCSKPEAEHSAETDHKYLRNTVLPEWHGWHAFRRGLATNLHRLGVDDKTIQAILRHSNVAVTQNIYIKTVSADAVAAMEKLDTALNDTKLTPKRVAQMPPATA